MIGGTLLFGSYDTNRLQGASNGTAYIDLSVKNSAISINGCNIMIPYVVENRSNKAITLYYVKLTDKDKAADMIYKSILKELVDIDVDVKNTITLSKAPSIVLLQINHEIDEIIYELQYEFISSQMRLLNHAKISSMASLSLQKVEDMKKDIESLEND